MQGDNIIAKQYLLGTLADGDAERLDLRLITDEGFAEELSLAEHELMEDYLEDILSGDERLAFERNFLVSPERRAMLREISLFKAFAQEHAAKAEEIVVEPSEHRSRALIAYFRPLLAGAALIAVIGVLWLTFFRDRESALQKEYTALNRQDLSELGRFADKRQINLASGGFRDAASVSKENSVKLTEPTLLRLALPVGMADGAEYVVKLRRAGSPELRLDGARAYRNPNGSELRVLLPKQALQNGQFQILVEAGGSNVGSYNFIVE